MAICRCKYLKNYLVIIICLAAWILLTHLSNQAPSHERRPSVLFLKTHKTGSSTVTGILFRELCLKKGINCFLPPADHPGRMWDLTNSAHIRYIKTAVGTEGVTMPFNAWLSHIIYNERIDDFLTVPTTIISIVRRPSLRFQSAWYWYNLSAVMDGCSLTSFAESQVHSSNASASLTKLNQHSKIKGKFRTGLDSYSQELTGIEILKVSKAEFQVRFDNLLQKIKSLQWFIVVNERMEESLVLLAYHLGWADYNLESLFHLRHKQQYYTAITNHHLLHNLDEIQPYDHALYTASVAALNQRIEMLIDKEKFYDNAKKLRSILAELQTDCDEKAASNIDEKCDELRKDNKQMVREFHHRKQQV